MVTDMPGTKIVKSGGRGRPKIEIDQEQFESLCELQCTQREMASFFRVSEDTIERWCKRTYDKKFCDVYEDYAGSGKIRLRRMMMQQAETTPSVAIFLAKNWLGMTDKQEIKATTHTDDSSKAMDAWFAAKKDKTKNADTGTVVEFNMGQSG